MIHILIGTKAQLIKMAPIMVELKKRAIPFNFIHTGQHRETIDDLLKDFNVKKPNHVLHDGNDIVSIFSMFLWALRILIKHDKNSSIWEHDKNGIVLVHGDTFSALIGAICAKRAGFFVGHVESGLRSFNFFHPFPEELTRLAVFRLSDFLFCPGDWAVENVSGMPQKKIINTNENTLLDAIKIYLDSQPRVDHIPNDRYIVASIHRFENIFRKSRLRFIVSQIKKISNYHRVIFILHPPTKKKLKQFGFLDDLNSSNIEVRPRYGYMDFISLAANSEFIITDGGSNQEEFSYLGKPCLIMRDATERQEGLNENSAVLAKYREDIIDNFLENYKNHKTKGRPPRQNPSKIIIDSILEFR